MIFCHFLQREITLVTSCFFVYTPSHFEMGSILEQEFVPQLSAT